MLPTSNTFKNHMYLTHNKEGGDKRIIPFTRVKVNILRRVEFELICYNVKPNLQIRNWVFNCI